MYYTPGWGALLAVASTLSGVALTQWNANRQSARQRAEASRAEHRQTVLDLLEATAVLVSKLNRFAASLDKGKKVLAAGTRVDPDVYYAESYKAAIAQANELTRAIRKGDLVITDKKIIVALQQLKNSAKNMAKARTEAGRAAEAGFPDSAALRAAITSLKSSGIRLSNTTRRQLARASDISDS